MPRSAKPAPSSTIEAVTELVDRQRFPACDVRANVRTQLPNWSAKVVATVTGQVRGPKLVIFKYKPKKRYRRKTGHRQELTRIKIDAIEA